MTTLKERLKTIANQYNLSIRAMEEKCGLSRSLIGNMSDSGVLGSDKLSKILDTFRDVDPMWLISGEGEMTKKTLNLNKGLSNKLKPRLPVKAAAGALSIATQTVTSADCELIPVIPSLPDYDFTIPIEGDSMVPDYLSGDELACRLITDISDIKWGKPYIIDTMDGVVFKRIFDGGSSILCRSINPEVSDFEIDKSNILHIASIVGFTRHA